MRRDNMRITTGLEVLKERLTKYDNAEDFINNIQDAIDYIEDLEASVYNFEAIESSLRDRIEELENKYETEGYDRTRY
jgi:phage shock protein A